MPIGKEPIGILPIGIDLAPATGKPIGVCCCPCTVCGSGGANFCRDPTRQAFKAAVSGFTDSGPFTASRFNGAWSLEHSGFCEWIATQASPAVCIEIEIGAGGPVYLFFREHAGCGGAPFCYIRYEIPRLSFRCNNSNVFTTPTVLAGCGTPGHPATVTVTPFGIPCGCCYPVVLPNTLYWNSPFIPDFGTVTLTYDPATASWKGTGTGHATFCPTQPFTIELVCSGNHFMVLANFTGFPADNCTSAQQLPTTCDPFLWQANAICATCYSGAAAITHRVVE